VVGGIQDQLDEILIHARTIEIWSNRTTGKPCETSSGSTYF